MSRLPDARSSGFVDAVLAARPASSARPRGIRNRHRPFAEQVFALLPGGGAMVVSDPDGVMTLGDRLSGDLVYLMLHGAAVDGTRMYGERGNRAFVEALNVRLVDRRPGRIVLTGACWGGLISDPTARAAAAGQALAPRTAESSIALAYLALGAAAVVGCTGSHYSPRGLSDDCVAKPIHRAFWEATLRGRPPAGPCTTRSVSSSGESRTD